jgi:hypothetical protein
MRSSLIVGAALAAVVALAAGVTAVRSTEKASAKVLVVEGTWTGTWGPFVAPKPEGPDKPAGEDSGRSESRLCGVTPRTREGGESF